MSIQKFQTDRYHWEVIRGVLDRNLLLSLRIQTQISFFIGNNNFKLFDQNLSHFIKNLIVNLLIYYYSVFQGFSKAKSANGGSILSSSQFLILPQLPQKIKLGSKVVKIDSKIIISLPKI